MATAYRLNGEDKDSISVSRSNDASTVTVTLSDINGGVTVNNFDYADFIKFMSTLSKNWGK